MFRRLAGTYIKTLKHYQYHLRKITYTNTHTHNEGDEPPVVSQTDSMC